MKVRSKFDAQLLQLNKELIHMGALCEEAIALAANALSQGDRDAIDRLSPLERDIDQEQRDIEALCMRLLLQQQPVARDLRQISAALGLITDMERIGDQAEDIGEILSTMPDRHVGDHSRIRDMARAVIKMVTDSVDAYVRRDTNLAQSVIAADDEVDALFDQVKASIVQILAQDAQSGESALDLLMIAKYFERIGDHACNIAEWVLYAVTGVHKEENE